MDWIPITERLPEEGQIVKILCTLETTVTYQPKEQMHWAQTTNAPMNAIPTHWMEVTND